MNTKTPSRRIADILTQIQNAERTTHAEEEDENAAKLKTGNRKTLYIFGKTEQEQ
jgi:ribosomal protein S8